MMEAYSAFAWIYDEFMDNIPYEKWEEYIICILKKHGIDSGIVAELGCGTGIMTRRLGKRGYDLIYQERCCRLPVNMKMTVIFYILIRI